MLARIINEQTFALCSYMMTLFTDYVFFKKNSIALAGSWLQLLYSIIYQCFSHFLSYNSEVILKYL